MGVQELQEFRQYSYPDNPQEKESAELMSELPNS